MAKPAFTKGKSTVPFGSTGRFTGGTGGATSMGTGHGSIVSATPKKAPTERKMSSGK